MSAKRLTVEEATAALELYGAGCPHCASSDKPAVWPNGNGAHIACEACKADQEALHQALRPLAIAAARQALAAGHNPLDLLEQYLRRQAVDANRFPTIGTPRRYGNGDAYDIPLNDGTDRVVTLGDADALGNQAKFRAAWRRVGVQLKSAKPTEFDVTVQQLLDVAEHVSGLSTDDEETVDWITSYLKRSPLHRHVDRSDTDQVRDVVDTTEPPPLMDRDGRLYLRLPALADYVNRALNARVTARDLSLRLARLGFTSPDEGGTIGARVDGKAKTVRYWMSPPGFHAPDEPRSRLNTRTDSTSRGNNGNTETPRREATNSTATTGNVAETIGNAGGHDGS